jgi:hypothetical protein
MQEWVTDSAHFRSLYALNNDPCMKKMYWHKLCAFLMATLYSSVSVIQDWRLGSGGSILGWCIKFCPSEWPMRLSIQLLPGALTVGAKHHCSDEEKQMWILTPLPSTSTWFGASLRKGPLLFCFYLTVLSERFIGSISLLARAYHFDFHIYRNTILSNLARCKI